MKTFIATKRTFDGQKLVEPGFPVTMDEAQLSGNESNLAEAKELQASIVEIAPIAPTGPNPVNPQQIPPDAIQSVAGYVKPGAVLVAEVTQPQELRIEAAGIDVDKEQTGEQDIAELMDTAAASSTQNDDDALVAGNASEVTSGLGEKTDEELERLRAAEVDRERPRKSVLSAIDKELASRQG